MSITNKLSRATLSAHFFLASLAAIGRYSLRVENINLVCCRSPMPDATACFEKTMPISRNSEREKTRARPEHMQPS